MALSGAFPLGTTVITPRALEHLTDHDIVTALRRHASGDWGDLSREDRQANDLALERGGRLLSAYDASAGRRFWIITEADRSATTILLPEDY